MHASTPDTTPERQQLTIADLLNTTRKKDTKSTPLPADPDLAVAVVLSTILNPNTLDLPAELFEEMGQRNQRLLNAPAEEIKLTLNRQVILLEALAIRQFQRAAQLTSQTSAAETYIKAGLATERVLIQALGAIHQMASASPCQLPDKDIDGELVASGRLKLAPDYTP